MQVQLRTDESIKRKLRRIGPAIEGIARKFNRADDCVTSSRDLAQEGRIAVLLALREKPNESILYYLTAAKNRMIDLLRSESGRSMLNRVNGLWYAKLIAEGYIKPEDVPKCNKNVLRIALMNPEDLEKIRRRVQELENFYFSQSLNSVLDTTDETHPNTGTMINIISNREPAPEIKFLAFELLERMRKRGVDEKKIDAVLMHTNGMTMEEIWKKIGVTASRICQILGEVAEMASTY